MKSNLVRVLPSPFVREYKGVSSKISQEVPEKDWAIILPLEQALNKKWDSQAHFQLMCQPINRMPGLKFPRVGGSWLNNLYRPDAEIIGKHRLPYFELCMLDLDHGGGKVTWEERKKRGFDDSDRAFFQLVKDVCRQFNMGFYYSRTGARLVGYYKERITADVYESWFYQFLTQEVKGRGFPIRKEDNEYGHHIDPACKDVGRLFKLPFVPGSDPSVLDEWYSLETAGPIPFEPKKLNAWTFGGGSSLHVSEPIPSNPKKYKRSEVPSLKRMPYFDRLMNGEPLAPRGERHSKLTSTAISMAHNLTDPTPTEIYSLLLPSVLSGLDHTDNKGDILNKLWSQAHYAVGVVQKEAEIETEVEEAREMLADGAFSRIADIIGCDELDAIKHVGLMADSGHTFIYSEEEENYSSRPVLQANALLPMMRELCPNLVGFKTSRGALKQDRDIRFNYCTQAIGSVVYDYMQEEVNYDRLNRAIILPGGQRRKGLTAKHSKSVEKWLALLAGDKIDALNSWLALFLSLDRSLCALYLQGPSGVGKNMLASGIAKLFNSAACKYKVIGERFQVKLIDTPFLYADETAELSYLNSSKATSLFREALGENERPLEPKGKAHVDLRGYIRVMIGTNTADALHIREDLSADDVKAIQDRVGYIKVRTNEAEKYLLSLTQEQRKKMVDYKIAEHVLWLKENFEVPEELRTRRFAAWDSDFAKTVKVEIGQTKTVAEAIGNWFNTLVDLEDRSKGLFRKDEALYVHKKTLQQQWEFLVHGSTNKQPKTRALETALRQLAFEEDTDYTYPMHVSVGEPTGRFWKLDPSKIYTVLRSLDVPYDILCNTFSIKEEK